MHQKWEYKVFEATKQDALQSELLTAGNDGWELVSSTAMFNTWMTKVVYVVFLKRPAR